MHCITFAFLQYFMHYRCVFLCWKTYVLLGLDWAEPIMNFFVTRHMIMHFSYICTFAFPFFFWYILLIVAFLFLSLFLLDSLRMAPKWKTTPSRNPLRFEASSSDPTPFHVRFYDEKAQEDFSENFSKCGIHLKHYVVLPDFSDTSLPTVIHSRRWESLCEIPVRCPAVIIQEFYSNMHDFNTSIPQFATRIWGTRIVVTPGIVFEILHVPRVLHPEYPSYPRLRTVSKVNILSLFCETPSSRGDHQNTSWLGFAKGLRFLNMVMTFVLYPLSHYNSITKPRAHLLLSLIEGLSIDFPSHFMLSLMDVYRDMVTRNKLIFSFAITRIICHFFASYPKSTHFTVMGAISAASVWQIKAQLQQKWPQTETVTPPTHLLHPPPLLLLLLQVVWRLRRSWRIFSLWMLDLTLSIMRWVRWPPVWVVLPNVRLALVASLLLPLHLHKLQRARTMMMALVDRKSVV